MASLEDVIAYLCKNYPYPSDLSKARLTKLVYLADWRSAITRGSTLTSIDWMFDRYGPYVHDVHTTARDSPDFDVIETKNLYGEPKERISLVGDPGIETLTSEEREILDHVIEKTSRRNWDDFIKLVYSTYPILSNQKGAELDLERLAHEYVEEQDKLERAAGG